MSSSDLRCFQNRPGSVLFFTLENLERSYWSDRAQILYTVQKWYLLNIFFDWSQKFSHFVTLGRMKMFENCKIPIFFYPRKFRGLKLVRKTWFLVESPQITHTKRRFWPIEKILILRDFRLLQRQNPWPKNMRVTTVFH